MTTIGAIVCNAHLPVPEIEWEVVHCINGEWFTNSDIQVWPFYLLDENTNDIVIPEGWLDHLHKVATEFAANRPSPKDPAPNGSSLLASLGLPTKVHSAVSGKLTRRV